MAHKIGSNRGNAGKGRPKGALNKTTVEARKAMEMAFDGSGGVEALTAWAKANRNEFYRIWGRLIPVEQKHTGDENKPIGVVLRFGDQDIPL